MSGNWTDGAWMYFTDWLRHQLSASFLTCITVRRLEQIERAWLTVLSWRICSCFSLVEEGERRTEGQVGGLALHGKRQLNPVTLVWSLRRGSSSALGQRGCRDGVFYKWVPLAVVLVCLLRFSVTITPNVMCSACAICHTFSVSISGEDSLGSGWTRADAGTGPSPRPPSYPKRVCCLWKGWRGW